MRWNNSAWRKNYLAFVVDEFGNFEGLVSIRDIMEEIAGNLPETGEESGICHAGTRQLPREW